MQAEKISVSLPASLVRFLKTYRAIHHCKSRSQVIEVALRLLQEQELEAAYREANQEFYRDWELTVTDGLQDKAW